MESTKLSSKGQVIIPKSLRDARNWKPGTELEIEEAGEALVLRPTQKFPRSKLEDVVGCLSYDGPRKTLKDLEEAISREAKKHAR